MVVGELDVVARLDDHQQNVPAPRPRAPARVVCLPPPPIERALGIGALMDGVRTARCEALAARVGGGDGPAPVVRFAGEGALTRALEAWARDDVAMLHVVGGRAQPGWARALLARWPRGLCFEDAVDDALDAAADEALRRSFLSPGANPCAPFDPIVGVGRGFVTGDARFAAARGTRDARVAYWSERAEGAEVRAAILGHDPALEAALRTERPRARLDGPLTVAITGVDGAGKSTQVAALADALSSRGLRVRVVKLYRQGPFLELANELSGRTRGGAAMSLFTTSRCVKLVDSLRVLRDEVLPAAASCDAIVFDRYLETHEAAAGAQLAWDLSAHPSLAPFPAVDVEFLLRLDAEVALARVGDRGVGRSADEHPTGLRGYAKCFDRIAARDGFVVLDARADRAAVTRSLVAHVDALLTGRTPHPSKAPLPSPDRPALVVGGDGLHVGGDAPWGSPGDDVCALAAWVRARWPEAAAGLPEGFWIEAYAAQVLLDLRASGASGAAVAWWPAALARDPRFADLLSLAELERMTLAHATMRTVDRGGEAAARRLRALVGDPAGRLARVYREALEAHAHERAWPLHP